MTRNTLIRSVCYASFILWLAYTADAQTTVYNNFGPDHGGWDYNYGLGWTVAGVNVPEQYGVEQAMSFTSTADGAVSDIWVAFFYVPFSSPPDTVTIKLARNPNGLPPDSAEVMEQWVITAFESWYQWSPPIHLEGNGSSQLQAGEDYWLWARGGETTWCGWCMNINPALTCPHTLRREGENWLAVANETASAFRVDVNSAAFVSVTLIPVNPPIVIPALGGRFNYNIAIANLGSSQISVDVWCMATLPNGRDWGPLLGPVEIVMPVGFNINRDRSQAVPGFGPTGNYVYHGYIGDYPGTIWDEDSFPFTKLESGIRDSGFSEWVCSGEPFNVGASAAAGHAPSSGSGTIPTTKISPNPFNPTTVASYEMRDASYVNLTVYDVSGHEVAVLVDGWREAGAHEVTFDGSNLAAGIYFARLEIASGSGPEEGLGSRTPTTEVQKMVLLK